MLSPSQKIKLSLEIEIYVCFFQHRRNWAKGASQEGSETGAEFKNFNSFNIHLIQLLKYAIPPPARDKKSGLQYLRNEKSYHRSAGVKTTGKNSRNKKV